MTKQRERDQPLPDTTFYAVLADLLERGIAVTVAEWESTDV
jgi:hypothetical protein